jgi:hypothetical protein
MLFLVLINNIDALAQLSLEIKKFADKTKLEQATRTPADNAAFQDCLDRMVELAETWRMAFNISKCKK